MAERNTAQKPRSVRPRGSVSESRDGELRVILEMPGVAREDLEVRIENNELRISGRRVHPAEAKYVLRERTYGNFLQTYTLGETVDPSKVDAVLTFRPPRVFPGAVPHLCTGGFPCRWSPESPPPEDFIASAICWSRPASCL